jgi:hypothetical protein
MRKCNASLILAIFCGCLSAAAAQSSSTCGGCHAREVSTQPLTQMGRAMQLPGDNPALAAHPKLVLHRDPYTYTVETHNGQTTYSVTDGTRTISIPVQWSMGSGAETWLLERDGQFYESMVSFYPSVDGLDLTVGDDRIIPSTLEEAIGRPLVTEGVTTCFGCHASNAVVDHQLNLKTMVPGVTCEHCHTGADAHSEAMMAGDTNAPSPKPGRISSEYLSDFCGQCHRTFDLVVRAGWHGPTNVRFQPYRLALSECFDGADPRISCLACHDPHQQVVRNAAFYDKKCLACHSAAASHAPPHAKVCPAATSNCASCHMPKTPLPGSQFVFTDHDIRVVKAGDPYPH